MHPEPSSSAKVDAKSKQRWDDLKKQLGDSPSPEPDAMQLDGTETGEEGGTDLTVLQLADGVLENINKCPECSKPILQSAIEEHSASCLAIREGRDPSSQPLKRQNSEASGSSSQVPKKSKLVLHLGGAAGDKGKTPSGENSSATPAPPEKKNKRIVDVDRQCGVINDKGYPCPRSLTCKTHNMSAKRAVMGRSQPYDILLFDWQKTNRAKEKPPAPDPTPVVVSKGTSSRPVAASTSAGDATASTSYAHGPEQSSNGINEPPPPPPKTKKRKSGLADAGGGIFKYPGDKKGKKGIVYVGEWEESEDEAGVDELIDSDEEVEAVLKGIGRIEKGRPLYLSRGGGAGFAAASMFNGRNTRLLRLHDTLRDVFRPA